MEKHWERNRIHFPEKPIFPRMEVRKDLTDPVKGLSHIQLKGSKMSFCFLMMTDVVEQFISQQGTIRDKAIQGPGPKAFWGRDMQERRISLDPITQKNLYDLIKNITRTNREIISSRGWQCFNKKFPDEHLLWLDHPFSAKEVAVSQIDDLKALGPDGFSRSFSIVIGTSVVPLLTLQFFFS